MTPAEYSWDHVLPPPTALLAECFSASAEQEAAAASFAPSLPPDGMSADGGDGDDDDLELHDPIARCDRTS